MKQDYTGFTTEQLLNDAFFIETIQRPTEETDLFWKMEVEEGIIDEEEFRLAVLYLQTIQVEDERISKKELNALWEDIEQTNKTLLKKKIKKIYRMVSAACIVLLVGFGGLFYHLNQQASENYIKEIAAFIKPDTEVENIQLLTTNKKPILITEEESDIRYEQTGELKINEKTIGNEAAIPESDTRIAEKKVYSQLIVPKGRRSTLTFSDGTTLWVNAGSRVIYPETFDAKEREIYVDGEVYLQVSSDKNWPFVVKTKKMDIQVLGTSFNVMAYDEDQTHAVVLVEGKVKIKSDNKQQTEMTPDHLFLYKEGVTEVRKVNVANYTSWTKGIYISKNENITDILNRLSRYYGKEIHYGPDLEGISCSGKLDLRDDLDILLLWLSSTAPIRYSVENGEYTVYIK